MEFKIILKELIYFQNKRIPPVRAEDYIGHPYTFIKEFRTIHLDLGRQTGKSEAMLDLFDIQTDLIIVHDMNAKDYMIRRLIDLLDIKFQTRIYYRKDDVPVKAISEIHRMIHHAPQYFMGKSNKVCDKCHQHLPNYFKTIWIDEPLLCQNRLSHHGHWEECMIFLTDKSQYHNQRIIKLGA